MFSNSLSVEKIAVQISPAALPHRGESQPIAFPDVAAGSSGLAEGNTEAGGMPAPLNDLEVEILMLNLYASLRVYERAHFFSWTQGAACGADWCR